MSNPSDLPVLNDPNAANDSNHPAVVSRWEFLRDVLVFQIKLSLDAIRDIILLPLSLGAAIIDLVRGGEEPGALYYRVFSIGRRSDAWINLFAVHRPNDAHDGQAEHTVDALVGQVEKLLIEEYERGGITASAKSAIDRSLDLISRRDLR